MGNEIDLLKNYPKAKRNLEARLRISKKTTVIITQEKYQLLDFLI